MKVRSIYIVFSILLMMLFMGGAVMGEKEKERKVPPDSPKDVSPLKVGDEIPDTTLVADNKESVNLVDLVTDKPAILIFYRGGW